MKIKKRSIIIPAFALLIGASLAGSISGTVAWYQYSTRVNAAYVGVSGGTSGNLQMRIKDGNYGQDGDWITRLSVSDIQTYLLSAANTNEYGRNIIPITSGDMAKDDAVPQNFYGNPVYGQEGGYASSWLVASKQNYVVIPLQLRYVERDGQKENGVDEKSLAKEVYLTDLLIQGDHANTDDAENIKQDLSDAVRFHINAYSDDDALVPANHVNRLISKKGGTTITSGQLDLDGDNLLDFKYNSDKYGFGGNETTALVYGEGYQTAFSSETEVRSGTYYNYKGDAATDSAVYPMIAAPVAAGSMDIAENSKEYDTDKSKSIGSTVASDSKYLNVNITIWIEGWQTFENPTSHKHKPIWNLDYIGSSFDVGFEFAVDTVE